MPRLVHFWRADGTILCRGLQVADVARPLPEAPEITFYEQFVTCPICRARLAGKASA